MKEPEGREVAFFGKITAAFTHEMKNVLAIIKESTGLMEDLLSITPPDAFPHRERFSRALSTVLEQVRRGVDMSSRLNRFAHSPDEPITSVDLNDLAEHISMLAHRFARLRSVNIKVTPSVEALSLVTSPVRLQMALFIGLECCWNHMAPGGEIELCVGCEEGKAGFSILCRGEDLGDAGDFMQKATGSDSWRIMQEVVTSLGGKALWNASGFGFTLLP